MGICSLSDVVPVEDELTPARRPSAPQWGDTLPFSSPVRGGKANAKKAARGWRASPGHHPISICSASAELRMMKSLDGGSTDRPEKRLTARSKLPHQAFTAVERPR